MNYSNFSDFQIVKKKYLSGSRRIGTLWISSNCSIKLLSTCLILYLFIFNSNRNRVNFVLTHGFFLQFSFHSYKIGALILFWHTRFCNSSPDRHKVSKQQSLRINAKNAQQFLHCLLWDHLPREMSELMPFTAVAPRNASISIPPPPLGFKPRSRRSSKAFLLIKNTKFSLTLNYRFITLTREKPLKALIILFRAKTKICACKMTFPFNYYTILIQSFH